MDAIGEIVPRSATCVSDRVKYLPGCNKLSTGACQIRAGNYRAIQTLTIQRRA